MIKGEQLEVGRVERYKFTLGVWESGAVEGQVRDVTSSRAQARPWRQR